MPFLSYTNSSSTDGSQKREYFLPIQNIPGFNGYHELRIGTKTQSYTQFHLEQPVGLPLRTDDLYFQGRNVSSLIDWPLISSGSLKKKVDYWGDEDTYLSAFFSRTDQNKYFRNPVGSLMQFDYQFTFDREGQVGFGITDEVPSSFQGRTRFEFPAPDQIFFRGQPILPQEETSDPVLIQTSTYGRILGQIENDNSVFVGQHLIIIESNIFDKRFADGHDNSDYATFKISIAKPGSYLLTRRIGIPVMTHAHSGGIEEVNLREMKIDDSIKYSPPQGGGGWVPQPDLEYLHIISNMAFLYFLGDGKNRFFTTLPPIRLPTRVQKEEVVPLDQIVQLQRSQTGIPTNPYK